MPNYLVLNVEENLVPGEVSQARVVRIDDAADQADGFKKAAALMMSSNATGPFALVPLGSVTRKRLTAKTPDFDITD